jgi:hypothetical protein
MRRKRRVSGLDQEPLRTYLLYSIWDLYDTILEITNLIDTNWHYLANVSYERKGATY